MSVKASPSINRCRHRVLISPTFFNAPLPSPHPFLPSGQYSFLSFPFPLMLPSSHIRQCTINCDSSVLFFLFPLFFSARLTSAENPPHFSFSSFLLFCFLLFLFFVVFVFLLLLVLISPPIFSLNGDKIYRILFSASSTLIVISLKALPTSGNAYTHV